MLSNFFVAIGQTSLFGQPQQQQAQPSAFGAKPIGFGQPTTSTPSTFGFGQPAPQQQPQQQTSIFGQAQQPKPFGGSIFGAPATSQPSTGFGTQPASTGFGFGTQQQVHFYCFPKCNMYNWVISIILFYFSDTKSF